MTPIFYPITDYATVQQCLVTSLEAAKQLKQEYTLITMDLAAAKIAYDIQWQNMEKFSKVIINLGAFHAMCSFMGSLGKMMTGSGLEDILIEAGVCASGSIQKVLSGKHYNRAMRVHQHMADAVGRMIIAAFVDSEALCNAESDLGFTNMTHLSELAIDPCHVKLQSVMKNAKCLTFIDKFEKFKNQIRKGDLGKTAQFWLMYCDCIWKLMRYQRSIKENNLEEYIISIRQLCSLLFSADHLNYARYLPVFHFQLSNLPTTHPGAERLLLENGFSVCRSSVPACRNAVDLTIEQTIKRSAKTQGGVIGFSRNVSAYQRWCVARHKHATYVDATLERLDMLQDSGSAHKSTRKLGFEKNNLLTQTHSRRQIKITTFFINAFLELSKQHSIKMNW